MLPLKILMLSAEVAPFAKAGGLADVCGSLPKALAALGHDVRLVMPAYQAIEGALISGRYGIHATPTRLQVPIGSGTVEAGVLATTLPGTEVPISFIAERQRFGNRPFFYGNEDDPYRFAFFSRAALDLTVAAQHWRPDVVHAHDWHTAAAVTWLSTAGQSDPRYAGIPTIYTIHNLMHQGKTSWDIFQYLNLLTHRLNEESFGEVNLMARGIYHATMVNTVSPTYAREIMTPAQGGGLDGLLRHRQFDVHGILNGIDTSIWNPATDHHLAATFNTETLERRRINKRALQNRAGLPQDDHVPLVAMVTRLDWQKGLDITGHVIHRLLNSHAGDAQFVVLGSGGANYEEMLCHFASYHRERMNAFIGYNAELAPLIYGGSDIFLMPSLFEPCGLGQLIAMRYGCVPVVRSTGGLTDTVLPGKTGFTFHRYHADDFWHSLEEALLTYRGQPDRWNDLQVNGMQKDHSWENSAQSYVRLYEWAIARTRGW